MSAAPPQPARKLRREESPLPAWEVEAHGCISQSPGLLNACLHGYLDLRWKLINKNGARFASGRWNAHATDTVVICTEPPLIPRLT
jgi:hypothetical protein